MVDWHIITLRAVQCDLDPRMLKLRPLQGKNPACSDGLLEAFKSAEEKLSVTKWTWKVNNAKANTAPGGAPPLKCLWSCSFKCGFSEEIHMNQTLEFFLFVPPNLKQLFDEFELHFSNFAATMSEIDDLGTSEQAKERFIEAVAILSWTTEPDEHEAPVEGKDEAPEVPEEGKDEAPEVPEEGKDEAPEKGEDDAAGDGDEDEGEEGRRIDAQVR